MANVEDVTSESIEAVLPKDESHSTQTLLKLLCAHRLKELERIMYDETQTLKKRQQRIRWLNSVLRAINQSTETKKGTLEIQEGSELEKIFEKGKELYEEAEKMMEEAGAIDEEIEELVQDPEKNKDLIHSLKKHSKLLKEEAQEIMDTVNAANVYGNKDWYGKEERERLVENIRMAHEDLTSLNNQQMQKVNRMNNERHETLLMAKMLAKMLNDDILNKARSLAR